ncbi:hypothetical protein [Leptolyngbya sp. FACHB-261]|uniref:hypothetical protein n=1 Tax=Leptolyngbya sp. FACHB-261 TaxID=2692806 RepID=UPI001681CB56|nr:hypothetical protein [Leptolyngbya sp. FACHB-261]MBD2100342.1 hypothetical protein [Leptolyngbya sp. FACHB-261]
MAVLTACDASAKSQPSFAHTPSTASSLVASSPTLPPTSATQSTSGSTSPPVSLSQSAASAKKLQQEAVQVIRDYYSAINRRDYQQAYSAWERDTAAGQQSFEQFRQGFASTASTAVEVGEADRLDGAAGSVYIQIPVTITAITTNGTRQRFRGSYILRRVNDIPGSTSEQRRWHLHSANITQVN